MFEHNWCVGKLERLICGRVRKEWPNKDGKFQKWGILFLLATALGKGG